MQISCTECSELGEQQYNQGEWEQVGEHDDNHDDDAGSEEEDGENIEPDLYGDDPDANSERSITNSEDWDDPHEGQVAQDEKDENL
jgi:hypothetical protein